MLYGKITENLLKRKIKKITQLEEKEELHLNRIDELTDRVVKLETNRDEVIEHCHKRLGFLENCVGGDEELIHTRISVHREYLKILERGKE